MELIIRAEAPLDVRSLEVREVARIERAASGIYPEKPGHTLRDGKTLPKQVREWIEHTQVALISAAWRSRMHCHWGQRIVGWRLHRIRTVFGGVNMFCRRFVRFVCRGGWSWGLWPLRAVAVKRSMPELRYLLGKWRGHTLCRRLVELFKDILPLADDVRSHAPVRRQTFADGERLHQRVTEPSEYCCPESRRQSVPADQRLTVAIDGT
jgi:hypothetical protein